MSSASKRNAETYQATSSGRRENSLHAELRESTAPFYFPYPT